MSSTRLFHSASLRTRRALTGAALIAYLLSVWGIPVPQATTLDTSIAFPCQHHRCGCNSAAECWQSCCCFTPQERIAWAKENHVSIPHDALVAMHDEEQRGAEQHCSGDCEHDHDLQGDNHHELGARALESAPASACTRCAASQRQGGITWVLAFQVRKCRGLSTLWVTCGAALPLEIQSLWEFDWAAAGEVVSLVSDLRSIVSSPPVPPPRG
jgi:hypothetical protein